MVLPGFHTPSEIQFDNTVQRRYNPTSTTSPLWVTSKSSVNKPTFHHSSDNQRSQQIGTR
eukprot:6488827-Amphidinium_carterae.2